MRVSQRIAVLRSGRWVTTLPTVGGNPADAEVQRLNVAGPRIGAVVAGSALMGIAVAFLALAAFNAVFFNIVNGRGWGCMALVVVKRRARHPQALMKS